MTGVRSFRVRHWMGVVAGAALCYGALAELAYRHDRLVDRNGFCVPAGADENVLVLGAGGAVFLCTAVVLALAPGRRWAARTAGGTLASYVLGFALAAVWYHHRMRAGAECVRPDWQFGYERFPWLPELLIYAGLAAVMVFASLLVGFAARALRPHRRRGPPP